MQGVRCLAIIFCLAIGIQGRLPRFVVVVEIDFQFE